MDRHDYLPTVPDGDPSGAVDEAYAQAVDEEGPPPVRLTESDLSQMDWDPRESLDDPHPGGYVTEHAPMTYGIDPDNPHYGHRIIFSSYGRNDYVVTRVAPGVSDEIEVDWTEMIDGEVTEQELSCETCGTPIDGDVIGVPGWQV